MREPPDIIVALDVTSAAAALAIVDAIDDAAVWYKVGPVLFIREGPSVVRDIIEGGKRVFLDLKWHDIPNTVEGAVAAAVELGCSLATLHLAGGRRMVEAAVRARGSSAMKLVGVGVLTSLDAAEFGAAIGRTVNSVGEEQERLVRGAKDMGLDGFVTAVAEAALLRRVAGDDALLVTPGIRRKADQAGDQRRADTPAEAVKAGSDLLVIGRPVTGAADPKSVMREIRLEMAG